MMRKFVFALVIVAIIGGSVFAWWKFRSSPNTEPFPVRIAFTSDTSGRIEPCGCFTGQLGGLTRVSSHLGPDTGDRLLYEIGDAVAGAEDFNILQYDYLLRAYSEIGYDAVNLGHREAKLPASSIRAADTKSPVSLVSANLLDASTREPLVSPWVATILKKNETTLRVATIGVVDPDRMNGSPGEGVNIARMDEVLRKYLPEMKAEADLLICLAFADEPTIRRLAEEFYEFAFILGGDVGQPSQSVEKINQSWILSTTNEARALGEIGAVIDPSTHRAKNVEGSVQLMVPVIPQDPAVKQHSEQYREDIHTVSLAVDSPDGDASKMVPGVAPAATFTGSQACAGCHLDSFTVWQKSGHAHAFDSLVQTNSHGDPACIKCHTVGFGELGGYLRSMGKEKLVDVGCESCHGPGSEHVRLRSTASPGEEVALKLRAVGAGQCTQCHHGEFSRSFEWDEFWPLIQHGKPTNADRN